MGEACADHR